MTRSADEAEALTAKTLPDFMRTYPLTPPTEALPRRVLPHRRAAGAAAEDDKSPVCSR